MSSTRLQHAEDVSVAQVCADLPTVCHLGGLHQNRGAGEKQQHFLRFQVQSEEICECFSPVTVLMKYLRVSFVTNILLSNEVRYCLQILFVYSHEKDGWR